MADILGVSSASISTSVRTLQSFMSTSTGSRALSTGVPDMLRSTDASHRAVIPSNEVSSMLKASVFVGYNIIGMLKGLANVVAMAGSSLSSTYSAVTIPDGTRVSVGTISSDVQRTLARIEELVDKTSVRSGNLLSSRSRDVTLKTSQYNGEVNVAPQPLDLAGLNLKEIDLHSVGGVQNALARLNMAISIAEMRVNALEQLETGLSASGPLASAMNALGATGRSELRGTLINFYA